MFKYRHLIGSILLVSGTSIGGGMLALPITTAMGGFLPSIVIYLITWIFMASTGLLFLEMCIWMDKEVNFVTMAKETLGTFGSVVTWLVYLFFFYCLIVAYVVGTQDFISSILGTNSSIWVSSLIFILFFTPIIYLGARAVEGVNNIFMIGLIVAYLAFIILGIPKVMMSRLLETNIKYSLIAFPVIFTSFGYQGVVPSLTFYLKKNAKAVRLVIIIGSFLPFIVYFFWEGLILGMIDKNCLLEAKALSRSALYPIEKAFANSKVGFIGKAFGFFALATSLLGVSLSLRDFLADGLKIKKDSKGRVLLCALIFLPPIILSMINPNIFIKALVLAGGVGSAFLLGLLPILMVFSKRYILKANNTSYQLWGGMPYLTLLGLFCILEIIFVSAYSFGWLKVWFQ